jgi:hypothetical protein
MSDLRERIKIALLKTAGGLELYEHERDEIADVLIRELGMRQQVIDIDGVLLHTYTTGYKPLRDPDMIAADAAWQANHPEDAE